MEVRHPLERPLLVARPQRFEQHVLRVEVRVALPPLVEGRRAGRLRAGGGEQAVLALVPVLRCGIDQLLGELVDEQQPTERREPVEPSSSGRTWWSTRPATTASNSPSTSSNDPLPERRAFRGVRIDPERVVARVEERRHEPAELAAADLEHPRRRRRQVRQNEAREVHGGEPRRSAPHRGGPAVPRRAVSISLMDFETRAIHEGQEPDPATGAMITPIYQTSTYVQEAVGEHKGYDYSRVANPTRHGARAVPRLARGRRARGRVLVGARRDDDADAPRRPRRARRPDRRRLRRRLPDDLAGLRAEGLPRSPTSRPTEFARTSPRISTSDTRIVWVETPSNPLLNVVDIRAAADAAHAAGALLVVDNTFATPYLQQPLALGADVVVHSTTKYLGGHSDVIGGFAATNDPTIAERLCFLQKSLGAVPGPFDSWLVLRGIKTLAAADAAALRERDGGRDPFLAAHPTVEQVFYPGLPTHPGHDDRGAADARLRRHGLVPRRLRGGGRRARRAHEAVPARGVARRRREPDRGAGADDARGDRGRALRPPRNLVRLSVGIESAEDLIADLESALVRTAAHA